MVVAGRACAYYVPYRTKRCTGHGAKMFYIAGVPLAHTLAFARVFPPLWGGLGWGAVAARVGRCKYNCGVPKQEPTIGCALRLGVCQTSHSILQPKDALSSIQSRAFSLSFCFVFLSLFTSQIKRERKMKFTKRENLLLNSIYIELN